VPDLESYCVSFDLQRSRELAEDRVRLEIGIARRAGDQHFEQLTRDARILEMVLDRNVRCHATKGIEVLRRKTRDRSE
jgi:hypothetical protein